MAPAPATPTASSFSPAHYVSASPSEVNSASLSQTNHNLPPKGHLVISRSAQCLSGIKPVFRVASSAASARHPGLHLNLDIPFHGMPAAQSFPRSAHKTANLALTTGSLAVVLRKSPESVSSKEVSPSTTGDSISPVIPAELASVAPNETNLCATLDGVDLHRLINEAKHNKESAYLQLQSRIRNGNGNERQLAFQILKCALVSEGNGANPHVSEKAISILKDIALGADEVVAQEALKTLLASQVELRSPCPSLKEALINIAAKSSISILQRVEIIRAITVIGALHQRPVSVISLAPSVYPLFMVRKQAVSTLMRIAMIAQSSVSKEMIELFSKSAAVFAKSVNASNSNIHEDLKANLEVMLHLVEHHPVTEVMDHTLFALQDLALTSPKNCSEYILSRLEDLAKSKNKTVSEAAAQTLLQVVIVSVYPKNQSVLSEHLLPCGWVVSCPGIVAIECLQRVAQNATDVVTKAAVISMLSALARQDGTYPASDEAVLAARFAINGLNSVRG